ncbi:hypothetical protein [Pedobacter puniceum]|uniref:Uncharacterized protein n=1 Tax=Pedobacter puniceum TaxID=2666136 RepID=A0A7K0FSR8_9SPHI|nr:hypothetical protein [Pedobacter puniceum]MRX48505.1 hypothetical protein [Pedobacter puniceum]
MATFYACEKETSKETFKNEIQNKKTVLNTKEVIESYSQNRHLIAIAEKLKLNKRIIRFSKKTNKLNQSIIKDKINQLKRTEDIRQVYAYMGYEKEAQSMELNLKEAVAEMSAFIRENPELRSLQQSEVELIIKSSLLQINERLNPKKRNTNYLFKKVQEYATGPCADAFNYTADELDYNYDMTKNEIMALNGAALIGCYYTGPAGYLECVAVAELVTFIALLSNDSRYEDGYQRAMNEYNSCSTQYNPTNFINQKRKSVLFNI